MQEPHSKLLNIKEATEYLFGKQDRTHQERMYRITATGDLPYIVLEGSKKKPRKYFTIDILDKWIQRNTYG
tara:strand:+ start:1817 stop:2029 length:213 start_codon:yes stop_codon:yes gene_type:complete